MVRPSAWAWAPSTMNTSAHETPVRPRQKRQAVAEGQQAMGEGLESAAAAMEDEFVVTDQDDRGDEGDQHREQEAQGPGAERGERHQDKKRNAPSGKGGKVGP